MNCVLIVGSSPDALRIASWDSASIQSIVAINNAWKIRNDWDFHIHPEDYPTERRPVNYQQGQRIITCKDYVPAQNAFGGFVYAGGTMAFTAAYWVLSSLKPDCMVFIGCDMVYPKEGNTHFYGNGEADPLRDDITLQSLEAKSIRLQSFALENRCVCVNLSSLDESRLSFPRVNVNQLTPPNITQVYHRSLSSFNKENIERAKKKEQALAYFVETGEYWKHLKCFDANELHQLDGLWFDSYKP